MRLVKQVLHLLYGSIISRCGLNINEHHRNQPNRNKLSHFYNHLKQTRISNKKECFNYKGGHGVRECCMHIKVFKIRAGLGYRHITLDY